DGAARPFTLSLPIGLSVYQDGPRGAVLPSGTAIAEHDGSLYAATSIEDLIANYYPGAIIEWTGSEALDAAYRERAQLLAWLAQHNPAVIAPASDVEEPGWQVLYLTTGHGQMTWHIAPRDAELFDGVEHVGVDDPRARWDGHSTEEKYERLLEHVQSLADRPRPPVDPAEALAVAAQLADALCDALGGGEWHLAAAIRDLCRGEITPVQALAETED
ncbi:hypothetical protein ACSNOC_13340, partial [Streptomyces sp. URMC 129]